ncbi:TetR/AcrR family transcriptional regulator [Spirosoma sp. KUDC1026]|uniref:TetR/AcrR family transcriptional regulator n=1 Tax=Spirosoma sp. KUDC1026 TaxID=2745947 RepID=UPI00159BCCCF|nr:TetR/AcrR family transcriptional regulator [Spirosoma sp. KUDC1026]QKZ14891.1 TetR/AcrR family transcriptional regulator [Spirosoma sp. KUDC1026]
MRPRSEEKEQAIVAVALQLIADEGLENLSMQRLAKEANISPRTIYLKYENKEDLLIKLFIEEVLDAYETAILTGFDETMDFTEGVQTIWLNSFSYLTANRHAFVLMQYGKSSPLLNKAYQERNIEQAHHFVPIHQFLSRHSQAGIIPDFPFDVYRALLFAPLLDLVSEYFDYLDRPQQIITEKTIRACCQVVINGLRR